MNHKEFHVTIRLLSTCKGGRRSAIKSGYRSLIRFDNSDDDFGFELTLEVDSLVPGEVANGTISIWASEYLPQISVGQSFEVREGSRVVGHGEISR